MSGLKSKKRVISAWCADDKNDAFTLLKKEQKSQPQIHQKLKNYKKGFNLKYSDVKGMSQIKEEL